MTVKRCGHILSCALHGIQGILVDIEVTILPGLPSFEIVGLGDSAVRESRNRVHAAIKNIGFEFPPSRVVACYAPAWLRKEGSAFDLPLALAILIASGQVSAPAKPVCAFGELSLSGEIRSVPGAICRAASCRDAQMSCLLAPAGNSAEIRSVCPDQCRLMGHLQDAADFLSSKEQSRQASKASWLPSLPAVAVRDPQEGNVWTVRDISTIIGQKKAVRALLIAAAGRHNLLLLGSPGCGKSSLAAALPDLLPPLSAEEALLVTRIYSASGMLQDGEGLISRRPFRMPHHSISRSALMGGGAIPVPGEISLAHQGVLFLDEMTEFHPEILDLLRQPIEEQAVRLVRLHHSMTYPADFMLIGAANPCRCGEYLEPSAACRCSNDNIRHHLNRLSGPLLDRIDLTVEMTRLTADELRQSVGGRISPEPVSQQLARQVRQCWQIQQQRCRRHALAEVSNARLHGPGLADLLDIPAAVADFAAKAAARFNLSVRGFQKILRVSRTIADLESCAEVREYHVAEAMQYRFRWPEGLERKN